MVILYAKEPCVASPVAIQAHTPIIIMVPMYTVNITGFFNITLGLSFTKDCFKAVETRAPSNNLLLFLF
jgi:hypothetical protein